jgi:hypothetical protein
MVSSLSLIGTHRLQLPKVKQHQICPISSSTLTICLDLFELLAKFTAAKHVNQPGTSVSRL